MNSIQIYLGLLHEPSNVRYFSVIIGHLGAGTQGHLEHSIISCNYEEKNSPFPDCSVRVTVEVVPQSNACLQIRQVVLCFDSSCCLEKNLRFLVKSGQINNRQVETYETYLTMSFLGVLNRRWTSLGPLSSTKFVSTVTSSAGAWLANRLEFWKKRNSD